MTGDQRTRISSNLQRYCLHYATPGRCGVEQCAREQRCCLSVDWLDASCGPVPVPPPSASDKAEGHAQRVLDI